MSVISDSCKDLLEIVNDKRTRDQVFDECARNKMIRVYEREDEEYDKLLRTLEVNIDSCEFNQVRICITKILRLLNRNRKVLLSTIERLW
jgi:hypothetical protein